MRPDRWQQIQGVYLDALDVDDGERATFLAEACAGDDELRREVESLLNAHEDAGTFLQAPAVIVAAEERLRSGEASPTSASPLGSRISHYQILSALGAGGMGEVYLAEDTRLRRKIALKLLPEKFTQEAERIVRFEQEARAASALNHPNIITIYDIGQQNNIWFMATEFVDGGTLRQREAGNAVLPLRDVLNIAEQIANALAAAHSAGVIHRDIKPDNVIAATPSSLANKIRAVQPTAGERKVVTALFADFSVFSTSGKEIDPEDLPMIINQALDRLSPTIFHYEGTVAQVLGNSMLAFFGAPLTHEDDAVRAVRAALEMVTNARQLADEMRQTQGLEFELRIGLNTGQIVIGHVTSQLKFEFTVVGDTVNLATRAQAAAPAMSVMITEDTQRLISSVFDCSAPIGLGVKGRSGEVRIAEVQQSHTERDRVHGLAGLESRMVGRAVELNSLLQLSVAVQAGLGRAAVIIGDPGLGKTRLLNEWKAATPENSLRWVEGYCLSYGQSLAYHLLQSLLRSLLNVSAQTDEAETRAALFKLTVELLGENAIDSYPYLAHLLSLKLEGQALERVRQLDPQLLQMQYLMSLRRLLTALSARQPLGLLLEDIHWADPSSVELLSKLLSLSNEAPVLFCCVTRPERDVPGWKLVNAARDVLGGRLTELTLRELTEADSQQLVANLLNNAKLPVTSHNLIFQKAEGNPFFVEEILRMLIERGVIVQRDDKWIAQGKITAAEIPDNLQSLLLARIDRLPEDVKRVLRVASVIGRQFSVKVLENVLE